MSALDDLFYHETPERVAPPDDLVVIQLVRGMPAQALSVSPRYYEEWGDSMLAEGANLTLKHSEDDLKLYRIGTHQPLPDGWKQINLIYLGQE
jgi:hypothetical protein